MKSRVAELISQAASEAALREVLTTPKPGLVDALGNGCHSDMDCALFKKSAEARAPYWKMQAECGMRSVPRGEQLKELRSTGLEMEEAMTAATEGINTHKGLIYLMSLLVCGAGRAAMLGMSGSAEAAAAQAAFIASGTVEQQLMPLLDGRKKSGLTNGERLFIEHGITGVRGEAERGFPSVTERALPVYRAALAKGAEWNDAGLAALLSLMLCCEDSNVMHRAGYGYWQGQYRQQVEQASRRFDPLKKNYGPLEELEKSFIPRRVSPGGAADLLSCTYFLHKIAS